MDTCSKRYSFPRIEVSVELLARTVNRNKRPAQKDHFETVAVTAQGKWRVTHDVFAFEKNNANTGRNKK